MSDVIVRGGRPGKVVLEINGQMLEVDSSLSIYEGLHALKEGIAAAVAGPAPAPPVSSYAPVAEPDPFPSEPAIPVDVVEPEPKGVKR